MTKRRQPTPKERKALYDGHHGICACGCGLALGPDWIAEHVHALALGGDNSVGDNVLPYRRDCADRKTNGPEHTSHGSDRHAIAKAKRIAAGGKKRRGRKLEGRGFQGSKRFNGEVVWK